MTKKQEGTQTNGLFLFSNREAFENEVRKVIYSHQTNRGLWFQHESPATFESLPEPEYEPEPIQVGPSEYVDRKTVVGVIWSHLYPSIFLESGHTVMGERWKVDVWSPEAQAAAMAVCLSDLGFEPRS